MQRKYYSGIGLLAGLLAIAMMTLISSSADARSGVSRGPAAVSHGSVSKALVGDPSGKFRSRVVFHNRKGTFSGFFVPTTFAEQDGKTVLKGAVAGKLVRPGHAARWVNRATTLTVNQASVDSTSSTRTAAALVSCNVLHLVLGPLDLDLLGLVVHLDRVVLDITAEPAGGLLGQLLCSVANLLNGGLGGLLGQLAILNDILAALGL